MTRKNDLFLDYQSEFDNGKDLSDLLEYEINKYFYAKPYSGGSLLSSMIKFYLHVAALGNGFRTFKNLVISSAYYNYNNHLREFGYDIVAPPGMSKRNSYSFNSYNIVKKFFNIESLINNNQLHKLLKYEDNLLYELENELTLFFEKCKIRGIVLPSDLGFLNRLSINAARKNNIPSFIFQHGGVPVYYNLVDFNRTDYLVVWGSKVKSAYISMGWDENKIFVSGHPFYRTVPGRLRFTLDNILILTKSASEAQLQDRKKSILYLLMIKRVLISFGIKKVRLRTHPSESPKWYQELLGEDFFVLDRCNLSESLNAATLVIGPNSTTLIDSLAHGVNYHVFEPIDNEGKTLMNLSIVAPLDGLDERIPISRNVDELTQNIRDRNYMDLSVFNEFADTRLNLVFFKEVVKIN